MHNIKPKIAFIGAGALATQLAIAFHRSGYEIELILSKTEISAKLLAEKVHAKTYGNSLKLLKNSTLDYLFLAIPDQQITKIAQEIIPILNEKTIVLHSSGSTPIHALSPIKNRGVFYPMQSFSKTKPADFSKIHIFLEAKPEIIDQLKTLALAISPNIRELNSEKRRILHLGAVFTNNFVNQMMQISNKIVEKIGLDHSVYMPLLEETLEKLQDQSPKEAQTGPAIREDNNTIKAHLKLLKENFPEFEEIYSKITELIQQEHYGK